MEKKKFQKQILITGLILIIPVSFIGFLIKRNGTEATDTALTVSLSLNVLFYAYILVINRNKLIKFEKQVKKRKKDEEERRIS